MKFENVRTLTLLVFYIIISTGCSHTQSNSKPRFIEPQTKGAQVSLSDVTEARKKLFDIDDKTLEKFPGEWRYNRNPENPPELGLALSGGGSRAASFSIGVMKALHKKGILQNVDVISTVSGGSYAAYWYYMQHLHMNESCSRAQPSCYNSADIFRTEGFDKKNDSQPNDFRFQNHLESGSDLLIVGHPHPLLRVPYNIAAMTVKLASVVPFIPINWIANGIFEWDWNVFPFRRYYQNGIERTYGFVPLKDENEKRRPETFLNDSRFLGIPRVDADKVSFQKLKLFLDKRVDCDVNQNDSACKAISSQNITDPRLKTKRLPFLVLNATAGHGRLGSVGYKELNEQVDSPPRGRQMKSSEDNKMAASNKIFEFTPLGYGSEIFGYNLYDDSGKSKEIQNELHFSKAVSISGAAVDHQYFKGTGLEVLASSTLRALNLNIGYHLDNDNVSQADRTKNNLLPFPAYLFQNYSLAQPVKKDESNQSRDFQIPSKHSTRVYLSDGGLSENFGLLSLIRRKVKNIIFVDAEGDNNKCQEKTNACFTALKLIKNV